METIETIKKRRSIRSYQKKPIPRKIIMELLELANLAPTAYNLQNRFFIVVQDRKTIKEIYEASFRQNHVLEASAVIVCSFVKRAYKVKEFLRKKKWGTDLYGAIEENYKGNEKFIRNWRRWKSLWPIQDNDAAITTLLLAATNKGVAACWIGLFDSEKIKEILKISKNCEVTSLVTLGYQKNPPPPQIRKPIEALVYWEKFEKK